MPQYAAGGEMDRLNRYEPPKKPPKAHSTKPLHIALFVVILLLLFGANLSSDPFDIISDQTIYEEATNTTAYTFTVRNNSIGLIFSPTYSVVGYDAQGNIRYKETNEIAPVMLPFQKFELVAIVKRNPDLDYSIEINAKHAGPNY